MAIIKLSESMIRAVANGQSFQRGREYYESGAISNAAIQGNVISGYCEGTSAPYYRVQVVFGDAGIREANCTCPYEFEGYCKHIVALLFEYLHRSKKFAVRQYPADLLARLNRDELLTLATQLLQKNPDLYDWVEATIAVPKTKSKTQKKKKKVDADIYRRRIVGIVHSLDGMRMSEAYWHVGGLVNQLAEVKDSAMKFLDAGDADTAFTILITLLEEASRGIENVDDSNGELGGFVGELGQPLAEAILSMELGGRERDKVISQLKKLIKYAGDYGMEGNLDLAIQAAQFGWEEITSSEMKQQIARDSDEDDEWVDTAIEGYGWSEEEVYEGHGWGQPMVWSDLTDAKLNVLDRQGRVEEYLELCKRTKHHLRYAIKLCELKRVPEAMKYAKKHLKLADEAQRMAERLRGLHHIPEAIEMGEHGLELQPPKYQLWIWLGPVEEAQGRNREALAAWFAAFPESPSLEMYQTLKRLAESRWQKLRPQVMEQLKKSGDKQVRAEVHLLEEEWDEAIQVAEGRGVWYTVVEIVADRVLKHRPEWVKRVSLKHAERLMEEVKSKNYPIAAAWLKRVKQADQQLGQMQEWKTYLVKVKEKYKRRPALQNHLDKL